MEYFLIFRGHHPQGLTTHWRHEVDRFPPDAEGVYTHTLGGMRKFGEPLWYGAQSCTETECSVMSNVKEIALPEPDPLMLLLVGLLALAILNFWRK